MTPTTKVSIHSKERNNFIQTKTKDKEKREQSTRKGIVKIVGSGYKGGTMWSPSTQSEKGKEVREQKITDVARNIRYIHMQISMPKMGNKTRVSKVKEALMIIFATSKHIKLHPKEEGVGEIITNIDDLVTTEEVTNQYFFDKKIGGKNV